MLLFFVPTPEANLTSGTLVIFDKKFVRVTGQSCVLKLNQMEYLIKDKLT